jgi:hypothetical protein
MLQIKTLVQVVNDSLGRIVWKNPNLIYGGNSRLPGLLSLRIRGLIPKINKYKCHVLFRSPAKYIYKFCVAAAEPLNLYSMGVRPL